MNTREELTLLIKQKKTEKGLRWSEIAERVGLSKEWVTAACLGQMGMDDEQSTVIKEMLDLPEEAMTLLKETPFKGSLPAEVPTDPLIYRFHEITSVFGTTLKELIQEEFGDGIMSAIDFSLDVSREPNDAGDRVKVVMSGKFLSYKKF